MLKRFVKVSNVTNLSVARYCAGMFVDLIGINVDKDNESYLDLVRFNEIRAWLSGVLIVIETESMDEKEIQELIELYKADFIQTKNIAVLNYDLNTKIIFEGNLATFSLLKADSFSFFQFEDYNHKIISSLSKNERNKLIFSAKNDFDGMKIMIDENENMAFDLKANKEQRPGFQNFDDLMEILEYLDE